MGIYVYLVVSLGTKYMHFFSLKIEILIVPFKSIGTSFSGNAYFFIFTIELKQTTQLAQ